MRKIIILIIFIFVPAMFWPVLGVKADTSLDAQNKINTYQQQIDQIQKQIDQYQQQIDANESQAQTLASDISSLNSQINKIQLEIKSLGIAISQATAQIADTQSQISDAQSKIDVDQKALATYMQALYETDRQSLTEVIFRNSRLSDFFDNLKNLDDIQNNVKTTMVSIKDLKTQLEQKESDLEDQKSQDQALQALQKSENTDLTQAKKQKNDLLAATKGQEAKFQQLVKKSQQDIANISNQITYLEQNGVTVEDAIKYGELAALRVGIRPAFLIAELEQESALGANTGKCYITDTTSGASRSIITGKVSAKGINPTRDLPLFISITQQLGKDPLQTPISCWPGYGWGGAMGPAQFIPSTWMGYTAQVAQILGEATANPWNIEDSFMAAAVKLANAGATAKTTAAEKAASKAYYSGNPKCSTSVCNSYANAVQTKSAIIEQNL